MTVKRKVRQGCDQYKEGLCSACDPGPLYCPPERAANSPPGTCSHHPQFGVAEKLRELKRGGVKIERYGNRHRDFVTLLHRAYKVKVGHWLH